MKLLWKVLAWLAALCGIGAYLAGWTALLLGTQLWVPTEFWFYDAVATGVFAIFFLAWGALSA